MPWSANASKSTHKSMRGWEVAQSLHVIFVLGVVGCSELVNIYFLSHDNHILHIQFVVFYIYVVTVSLTSHVEQCTNDCTVLYAKRHRNAFLESVLFSQSYYMLFRHPTHQHDSLSLMTNIITILRH